MSRIGCAVLGATGAVGQRFVQRLADHPDFEVRAVTASERSQGKLYRDAADWILDGSPPEAVADLEVTSTERLGDDVRVVFSALPGGKAGPLESDLARRGFAVFSNASDHRMDRDVPLLIPEVNPDHIDLVERQGTDGFIVANGNCSGIVLTLALAPIHRAFDIEEADITTLQGLSGAGYPGVPSLDVVDNVVPFIGGEEEKLHVEPHKTLGSLDAPAVFPLRATCTRVPVREGHLESVHLRLGRKTDHAEVEEVLRSFRGPPEVAALPSAPKRPIHVLDAEDRPQPRRDRDLEGGMAVSVGRIRVEGDRLQFLVLGHNTIRGAAGQSVLNAEFAKARGLLVPRKVASERTAT